MASAGRLSVIRRASDGVCVASELHATYPLRLHIVNNDPTSSSKALCCYLIGFGGGIVSGDHVQLDVNVGEHAALLITSQSTSKSFRSVAGRPMSEIQTTVTVKPGALMVWSPQPTQCFKQSNLSQSIHVTLERPGITTPQSLDSNTVVSGVDENAPSLVLLDWYTGGRRNIDDGGWQLDCLKTVTTVSYSTKSNDDIDKELIFRDASMVSGSASLQRHMGHFQVVAMMILIGPRVQRVAQELLSTFSSRNTYDNNEAARHDIRKSIADGFVISCGTFPTMDGQPHGVLVRIASQSLEQVARFLSIHVGTLDGQLSYDPFSEIVISRAGSTGPDWHIPPSPVVNEVNSDLISSWIQKFASSTNPETKQPTTFGSFSPSMLYQLVDSSTPTGGFAHSNTLEAAMQMQLVQSAQDLFYYTWDYLLQTMSCLVPFLIRACSIFRSKDDSSSGMDAWDRLDQALSVTVTSHVTNRASCFQGSALLRAFGQTFPEIGPVLNRLRKRIQLARNPTQRGHAVTCFGAICGLVNVEERLCVSMFIYTTARDMINAAVRLNLVGPLQGGHLIHQLCTKFDELVLNQIDVTSIPLDPSDQSFQAAPLIEILANAHDRLYTRLFNS